MLFFEKLQKNTNAPYKVFGKVRKPKCLHFIRNKIQCIVYDGTKLHLCVYHAIYLLLNCDLYLVFVLPNIHV
jgi:hypothetical protein